MKKRVVSLIIGVSLVLGLFGFCTMAEKDPITVEIDGVQVDFDVDPKIVDGRTLVPMRKIFEEIGALVKWNEDTQTVYAKKSSKEISMKINSEELVINKGDVDENNNPVTETVALDVPTQIFEGRTLVSTRAISEAFGLNVEWDEDSRTVKITSKSESDDLWKENVGKIDLNNFTYTGDGIEISENKVIITKGGDFTVTGTLEKGSIVVNSEEKVKIRLDNVNITSENEPCVFVENADKAYITVKDGTTNTLTAKISEKGAVYSKDNLEIKGNGTIFINSDYHGIKASDNLTIENGNIGINSKKDGINVNDTFKMTGGTLKITSETDGIDCESIVIVEGGIIDITTTERPIDSVLENEENNNFGRPSFENNKGVEFEESAKGIKADWMMCVKGGNVAVNSTDHAIHCADEIEITGGSFTLSSEYKKGISAHGNLTIDGENTKIDVLKSTEGLESKNILTINNGDIKISATDDGINATGGNSGEMGGGPGGGGGFNGGKPRNENEGEFQPQLLEQNGEMKKDERPTPPNFSENNVENPFEKRKEHYKDFDKNNGMGQPQTPPDNNFKQDNKKSFKDCLIISGGNFEIYAEDDCIDSNGNLIVNGGVIKATKTDGTFLGNFGVFDPDGELTIGENATLILATLQGEERSLNLSQNSIIFYCDNRHQKNEKITLKDENGGVLAEYTPIGDYQAVLIASQKLQLNKNYTLTVGEESHAVTMSEKSTVIGTKQNQNNHGKR